MKQKITIKIMIKGTKTEVRKKGQKFCNLINERNDDSQAWLKQIDHCGQVDLIPTTLGKV